MQTKKMRRVGVYNGHNGPIRQLLCLGDNLFSLGSDGKLIMWKLGEYEAPQVLNKPSNFTGNEEDFSVVTCEI